MHAFFTSLGLRSYHATDWSHPARGMDHLDDYDAFSDGGGHFWDPNLAFGGNHDIAALDGRFPQAGFILQHRAMKSWLVSKMIHAGWKEDTEISPHVGPLTHEGWRTKSLEAIHGWVENRLRYHAAVLAHFARRPGDLLVIDALSDPNAADRLARFVLGRDRLVRVERMRAPLRWANRTTRGVGFAPTALPWVGAAGARAEDKMRCAAIVDEVLADHASGLAEERERLSRFHAGPAA